jgi:16S rRNA U516 pseudouridylate synthase RsuA-like enzyme
MSELTIEISTEMKYPITGYAFRTFIVHKPVGVVSSTVDTGPTELIKKKDHPRFGLPKNSEARMTVYDVARNAGFPTDCGLVGRLDLETSGIMVPSIACF